jgi:hypothetical protein
MTKKPTEERWPEPVYLTADHAINMSLRDYFAAKAMQGLIAHEERAKQLGSHNLGDFDVRVAVCAYRYADAMLKARAQ